MINIVFEELEECTKKAAEDVPAQVIHVVPHAIGFDPI